MAGNHSQQVCGIECHFSSSSETWGFAFLEWCDEGQGILFQFGSFSVRDGSQVRFWEDIWLGNNPLMVQYPSLYKIVRHKFVTIKQVLGQENPDISFRRDLFGPRLAAWNELLTRLEDIQLSGEPDIF